LQPLARRIFGGLSGSYERVLELATLMQDRYWKAWLLRKAAIQEGATVLDIGCGTGLLEERLADSGARITGVDLTEEMLRLAQRKPVTRTQSLGVADGEHLPFRDESFDLVLSCYVVKYCNETRLASEMVRVLRPGGGVFFYDFTRPRGPFAPLHALYAYGALRILGKLTKPLDPGLAFTYEALPSIINERRWDDSMQGILEEAGLSEVGSRRLSGGVVTAFWGMKSPP
jgi:demethylmenaquinone methyltransferase / 2-methoxy-6-polyprenyl-1,4-benzoquinol methylase